jgi:hypothetical protein
LAAVGMQSLASREGSRCRCSNLCQLQRAGVNKSSFKYNRGHQQAYKVWQKIHRGGCKIHGLKTYAVHIIQDLPSFFLFPFNDVHPQPHIWTTVSCLRHIGLQVTCSSYNNNTMTSVLFIAPMPTACSTHRCVVKIGTDISRDVQRIGSLYSATRGF